MYRLLYKYHKEQNKKCFFKKLRNTEIWKFEKEITQRLPYSFPMPLVARTSYLSKINCSQKCMKKNTDFVKNFFGFNFFHSTTEIKYF